MLKQLQNLPENQKKIILFSIVGLLTILLISVFISRTKENWSRFKAEQIFQDLRTQELKEQTQRSLEQINQPFQEQSQNINKAIEELLKDAPPEIQEELQKAIEKEKP